jgi:hypothetical protein
MTIQYQVAGPALIKVGTGAVGALESLGYTRDSAEMEFEGFFEELKSDDAGGEQGPPGDLNYLSERARIRLEFTKWDAAIADKVVPRVLAAGLGVVATTSTIMIQGAKTVRLLILPTIGTPFNFPLAVLRGNITLNKGAKHSRLVLEFEAYKAIATGLLYNAVTA